MIELNKLFLILRRRAWLLALGLIVGLLVGYLVSNSQVPTYEASTKLLVSNQLQGKSSDFAGLSSPQLVLTYIQMLKTKDLRDKASEKVGFEIHSSDLTISQVGDTQIIEILVQGNNPKKIAMISNAMADALMDEVDSVRTAQLATSEGTLMKQVDEAKAQIDSLQKEFDQTNAQIYQDQLTQVEKRIADIQKQIATLEEDIIRLSYLPTIENRSKIADKEDQIVQLQSSFKLYDELRANLIIMGKPSPSSKPEDDSRLQQIRSTITSYQKVYTDLLSSLEATQLAQSQQSPNILQIQVAFAPANPISPVPIEYSILSGLAGVMLAAAIVFVWETLGSKINWPTKILYSKSPSAEQKK